MDPPRPSGFTQQTMVALSCASWTVLAPRCMFFWVENTWRSQVSVISGQFIHGLPTKHRKMPGVVVLHGAAYAISSGTRGQLKCFMHVPRWQNDRLPHLQGAKLHLTKSQVWASFGHKQSLCPSSVHQPGEASKEHPAHPCSSTAITFSPSTEALGTTVSLQPQVSLPAV